MSKVISIHHIVFSTKYRRKTLLAENRRALFMFIFQMLKERNIHLYRIGGAADHVHMLVNLPSSYSPATLMNEVKRESSKWAKGSGLFPRFEGWSKEYASFSCGIKDVQSIVEYIRNQEEHHRNHTFVEELTKWFAANGLKWVDYDDGGRQ